MARMGESGVSSQRESFEEIKQLTPDGREFWFARDLAPLLEYVRWDTFEGVVKKAALAAHAAGSPVENHFSGVRKMVSIGYGNDREITDYTLSRYACYLIAQNADSRKRAVAEAQTYFAVQTRKQEVQEDLAEDFKRVEARRRLTETEKKFSGVLNERSVTGKAIAEVRSSGDQILFGGYSTQEMKKRYGITGTKPLADFLPTVTLKAKDLAAEMTTVNTLQKDLKGKDPIKNEHDRNNLSVRRALEVRAIKPELLPAEEDVKKVQRRLDKQQKQLENGQA